VAPAIPHLCQCEVLIASIAMEHGQVGPHLPENLFPRYPVGLSDVGNEPFQIPFPVNGVLGTPPPVGVDVGSASSIAV